MINIDSLNIGETMWLPTDYDSKALLNSELYISNNKFEIVEYEEDISCKRIK